MLSFLAVTFSSLAQRVPLQSLVFSSNHFTRTSLSLSSSPHSFSSPGMSAPPLAPSVSSRFVSSTELEAASQKRQEEWKAAYERIGQEPPKQDDEGDKYDPRSLWEKLQENKVS